MKKAVVLLGLSLLLFSFAMPAAAQAEGAGDPGIESVIHTP